MNAELLIKVADVLDALAERNDKLAARNAEMETDARKKIIEPVLERLAFVTGESHDSLEEKLAKVDQDMIGLFSKLTVNDQVSELGGPDTVKSASGSLTRDESASAVGDSFLGWIVS